MAHSRMGVYAHSMLQVFGVDEQEPLCVSRLAGADQRQRITPQWSGTGDGGKHGHLEREVEVPNTSEAIRRRQLLSSCFQGVMISSRFFFLCVIGAGSS